MNSDNLTNISTAKTFSNSIFENIRPKLVTIIGDRGDLCVVAVGSVARREASKLSDLDFFVVVDDESKVEEGRRICESVAAEAGKLGIRPPATGGAFAECVTRESILKTIGGSEDSNQILTRRMLFLMESDWLFNESMHDGIFSDAAGRYIRDTISQHQICRFLLNDLIRYYRTICVDFEHKVADGKSWGDRNVKLLFARKLLYFSGILAVAETSQHTATQKREILQRLLKVPPIDRVLAVCKDTASVALARYDYFLGEMKSEETRRLVRETTEDRSLHSEEFRKLKNEGHHFSDDLEALLRNRYAPSHPIHQALMF